MGLFSQWLRGLFVFNSPQELMQAARDERQPREKGQVQKRQTRYTYDAGPMFYLGQQVVRAMEDAGFPAKIHCCFRPPDVQADLKERGFSKAGPWESPHQFYEAVDIIHPAKGWKVSPDYWEALASCVRIVADKYGVDLVHGHYWRFVDRAHVELKDWRSFRDLIRQRWLDDYSDWNNGGKVGPRPVPTAPTVHELWGRFQLVLPAVAADYARRRVGKLSGPPVASPEAYGR